jgi:alpha-ribazole phosphatase
MRVVLIRHLAPLVEPGTCYGRLDIAPDPAGEDQARAIARHPALSCATHVWTSPALRCRMLAEKIATTLPAPLTAEPRLMELDFGEWEGKPWDAVERGALDHWAASPLAFAPPGGETGAALIARVEEFYRLLRRYGRDSIVVSHGGPLKILFALLNGTTVDLFAPPPPPGSVNVATRP